MFKCVCAIIVLSNILILHIAAIRMKIELDVHTGNETHLGHIRRKLPQALEQFQPDIVVYNAGESVTL